MPGAKRLKGGGEFPRLLQQTERCGEHVDELGGLLFDVALEERSERRVQFKKLLIKNKRGDMRLSLDAGERTP
jgi:hypothetical protein